MSSVIFYMRCTLLLLHIEERVLESREREGKNNDISDKTLKLNKLFWVLFRV